MNTAVAYSRSISKDPCELLGKARDPGHPTNCYARAWAMPSHGFTLVELVVVLAVLCGIAYFAAGFWKGTPFWRGSATQQFKAFVAKAERDINVSLNTDQSYAGLTGAFQILGVSYDVKRTDSMIRPYIAEVEIAAKQDIQKPRKATGSGSSERLPDSFVDTGRRRYSFKYAFQDGRWGRIAIDAVAEMNDGSSRISVVPDFVLKAFSPGP